MDYYDFYSQTESKDSSNNQFVDRDLYQISRIELVWTKDLDKIIQQYPKIIDELSHDIDSSQYGVALFKLDNIANKLPELEKKVSDINEYVSKKDAGQYLSIVKDSMPEFVRQMKADMRISDIDSYIARCSQMKKRIESKTLN